MCVCVCIMLNSDYCEINSTKENRKKIKYANETTLIDNDVLCESLAVKSWWLMF
jgi:hypothetical protein